MTDEELTAVRKRVDAAQADIQARYPGTDLLAWYWLRFSPWEDVSASYCIYLLAEVEQLRTTLRTVIDQVTRRMARMAARQEVTHDWPVMCVVCWAHCEIGETLVHKADCPMPQAAVLLGEQEMGA